MINWPILTDLINPDCECSSICKSMVRKGKWDFWSPRWEMVGASAKDLVTKLMQPRSSLFAATGQRCMPTFVSQVNRVMMRATWRKGFFVTSCLAATY